MAFSKISSSLALLLCLIGLALLALPSHAQQDSPQDFLDAHNEARREVGLDPVTWDENMANFASNYANKHTDSCTLIHSGDNRYGENLALFYWGDMSARDAVNMWVSEKANYDFKSKTCAPGKECGHYTQVIGSVRIGCGKARCKNKYRGTIISCNYAGPGNPSYN